MADAEEVRAKLKHGQIRSVVPELPWQKDRKPAYERDDIVPGKQIIHGPWEKGKKETRTRIVDWPAYWEKRQGKHAQRLIEIHKNHLGGKR